MTRPRNFPDRVEAVIFDFDETMIDLESYHAAASNRLCDAMGSSYSDLPEDIRTASGRRIIDEIADMRRYFKWERDANELLAERQKYFEEELARSDELQLMSSVEKTIRALHARGFRLAITTSAVRKSVETILRRFDLLQLFTMIVDGSEVRHGKPDPEAYRITAERLDVSPETCVVFEDSSVGVRAAKAAVMYCIAVRNMRAHTWQDLSPADMLVTSFDAIDVNWFATSSQSRRSALRRGE